MVLIKLGEEVSITPTDFQDIESLAGDFDLDIENRMKKFAQELKVIAPQAKDFLYFTAVMMHAAEASCVNDDGSPKKLSNGEEVIGQWEKVGNKGGVKWVCNDPNIKPYKNKNCLIPGTDILMADGSRKAIEDIQIGDEVITHKGRIRKVTETFKHENNSEIYELRVKGHPRITITSEHPLFSIFGKDIRKKGLQEIRKTGKEPEWRKVRDIEPGDVLTSLQKFDTETFNTITPNQARLLGYFAAEGCYSKKYNKRQGLNFTFGYHEDNIVNYAVSLFEEEFPECSVKVNKCKIRGVQNLKVSGYGIAEWFFEHTGEYSHDKKLSKDVVFGSDEVKRQFLLGWMESDGCISTGNKLVGISTSSSLSWQIWLMLKSLGLSVGIRKVNTCSRFLQADKTYKNYPCRSHYRIEVYGAYAKSLLGQDSVKYILEDYNHKFIDYSFDDKYTMQRLRDVEIKDYQGFVYNFEVEEDHSYIANGIIVHNSDIFPEPELKIAYKDWVGKPLCLDHQSDSVDKIRGVIVDTVYDDKRKRVIALCALDAKNYPDLADKVKTGVSADVSMGTAVSQAVCTECQTVASTERDFCHHMKNRSCYGEINLGLSPIELSLVVSGADPKAKVKHIIASDIAKAAGLLSDYLNLKKEASGVSTQDLESVKEDLKQLTEKVQEIVESSSKEDAKEDESDAVGPTRSRSVITRDDVDHNSVTQINAPEAFPTYASELQKAILGAQVKIAKLQENLSKLSKNEEPTMIQKNDKTKKAYFQGTEEPKPGQQQYPVDPLNEKAREEDKTLVGKPPFPGVGDVDGLYPGDAEKKKELQRLADAEERAMFREAALRKAKEKLKSKAYFQGTEEPKPGGQTYTPDPLNEKARMEDKHMVGKAPFPGVGDVEGLYGDDLATKEKLSRASLRARFEKIAQPDGRIDKSASRWIVFANEKPILAATVDQITKGNSGSLYDAVATKRFGQSLLSKIETEGFKATASALFNKTAQAAPPAAEPVVPVESEIGGELEAPEEVLDEGGDPEEIVGDIRALVEEMQAKLSDLEEKYSGAVSADAAEIEGVVPANDEAFEMPAEAAPKTATQLQRMRKRVNAMLQDGISETTSSLKNHIKELKTVTGIYKDSYASMNSKQRDYLNNLTIDAVKDAKGMLVDASKLMKAVVKYAHGTAEIKKRAAVKPAFKAKFAQVEEIDELLDLDPDELEGLSIFDTDEIPFDDDSDDEEKPFGEKEFEEILGLTNEDEEDEDMGDASLTADIDGKTVPVSADNLELSLASKEARAEARLKLAQKGLLGNDDLLNQAHPGGSVGATEAGNLDVTPTAPGSAFHTLSDKQKAMLATITITPQVKKQAAAINTYIKEGKLKAKDVDDLIANGVDADAVKYWKALWGEAKDSESNEFANKLTQGNAQEKQAQDMSVYKAKVKRAYEMAHKMVSTGFIVEAQVDKQVEDIMKWNDEGFESVKRMIDRQSSIPKQASTTVPSVGLLDAGAVLLPAAESQSLNKTASIGGSNLKEFFDDYFAKQAPGGRTF